MKFEPCPNYAVTWGDDTRHEAEEVAKARFEAYKGSPSAKYTNTLEGHTVGAFGELIVRDYFLACKLPVVAHFKDDDALPDLMVAGRPVEVKCQQTRNWSKFGGNVTKAQAEHYGDTGVIAVVFVELSLSTHHADVWGWGAPGSILAAELVDTGPPSGLNHIFRNFRHLRALRAILEREESAE